MMKAFCEKCFKEVEVGDDQRCPGCGRDVSYERKRRETMVEPREGLIPWGKVAMIAAPFAVLAAVFLVWGRATKYRTESDLLSAACAAIRDGKWERFAPLTVTTADFVMQEQRVSPFERSQTFAGGVLKVEEQKKQQEAFRRAAAGGAAQIDFRRARFVGVGRVVREEPVEILSGGSVPVRIVSLRVDLDGKEQDTLGLPPWFAIVKWKDEFRLLGLVFPGKEGETGERR